MVKLYIQGLHQGEPISISAMISPLICSPLPSAVEVDNYPHLQGLQLVDECDQLRDIDILVGSNLYWNIVTGDVVRAQGGPTAVSSKLGWLLLVPINSLEANPVIHTSIVITVYCKLFMVENFRVFCGSFDNRETFTVKEFLSFSYCAVNTTTSSHK